LPAPVGADSSTHPYLRVLQQQVQVAEVQRQVTNRRIFPSLSVLGGFSSRGSGLSPEGVSRQWSAGFHNRASNYLAGLALTWNLTTAYNSRLESQLAQQQVRAYQARYQRQALKQQTTLQAISARLREQQKQIADARQAVAHAGQAYESYVARYESGLISMTELLQLQFLLQQSEKAQIEASQQFWMQVLQQAELSGDFSYLSQQF
jgi:outer membrane protein TolC